MLAGTKPFFEEERLGGASTWKHFIDTPEGVVEVVHMTSTGARSDKAFLRDHLGSTVSVSDENGIEYLGFDAWGRRRNANGSDNPSAASSKTNRGFTGHEHLDDLGIIHMNGRMYDPVTGRFLAADAVVQAPFDLQSYNRYSYVLNNPLSLTDASGHSWWTEWRRPIVAAIASFVTYGIASELIMSSYGVTAGSASVEGITVSAQAAATPIAAGSSISVGTVAGIGGGAAGGFAAGGIMSGNIESAVSGAFSGAITGGVGGFYGSTYPVERIAANSIVGGLSSLIHGGTFWRGAKPAFITSLLAYGNVQMRNQMIAQSTRDPRNDGTGLSQGMFFDGFKLAGARFDPNPAREMLQCSPLGCLQSGPGSVFGVPYGKGGFVDLVMESFAGPHDKANSFSFYDSQGLIRAGTDGLLRNLLTNYTTSLAFAAPFAIGAIAEQVDYSAWSSR